MATIRSMAPADYPAVAAMADDATGRALLGRPTWETAAEVAAEVEAAGDRAHFLVAEDDSGAIIGMAGYKLTAEGEALLYGPLVVTEGHGVGAWLESRVVTLAAQHGATVFSMSIGLSNKSGAAWAEWRGYQADREEPEQVLAWLYPGDLREVVSQDTGTVRPATPADMGAIGALAQDCHIQPPTSDEGIRVIERDGLVAGVLQLEPATGWITVLCVAPPYRRRGLGAHLLTQSVRECWQSNPRRLGITLSMETHSGIRFARRMGFQQERPVARWLKR